MILEIEAKARIISERLSYEFAIFYNFFSRIAKYIMFDIQCTYPILCHLVFFNVNEQ